MNIKCLFRKHDWEEAHCYTQKYIINNLLEQKFRKSVNRMIDVKRRWNISIVPAVHLDVKLSRYVCLRKDCCAIKDEVKEFLDYWRQEAIKEIERNDRANKRNKKAKEKFKNCLEEKE